MKITLTTAQAVSLAKSIAPAISTEPIKRHLHMVEIKAADDSISFTATDGYRMHKITAPQFGGESFDPLHVGGVELVGALLIAGKAIGKGSAVIELAYDYGDVVVVTGGGTTSNVPVSNLEFPACASIMNTPADTDPDSPAYFHGPYLADMITAASLISGKTSKKDNAAGMVKFVNLHPRKPAHVQASGSATGLVFHGLLMPQRG